MYVRMYSCTHVRMYACMYVHMHVCRHIYNMRMYVCAYLRTFYIGAESFARSLILFQLCYLVGGAFSSLRQ